MLRRSRRSIGRLALREIHRVLGGTGGGLLMAQGADWSIDNSTIPAEAAQSYAEYYYQFDYVLEAVERGPVGACGPERS